MCRLFSLLFKKLRGQSEVVSHIALACLELRDFCRAEIVYLVDFKNGIYFFCGFEYFRHLVGGYGVNAAAERVKLYKLETVIFANDVRGGVKS